MIPLKNAVMSKITAGGTAADYDAPASAGTDRWTGSTGIYVDDRHTEIDAAMVRLGSYQGRVEQSTVTRLELPYEIGILVQQGDSVTYTFEGVTLTRTAEQIIRSWAVGRVQVRVELV